MSWLPTPLTPDDGLPFHLQIRRQITNAVTTGELQEGTKLPGVRALAEGFGVNRLTVLKAIRFLKSRRFLFAVRGKGVYVAPDARVQEHADTSLPKGPFFEGIAEGAIDNGPSVRQPKKDLGDFVAQSLNSRQISFGAGFPPEALIPTETIKKIANRILAGNQGAASLGYALSRGDPELVKQIEGVLDSRGYHLKADDFIMITSGAQQAIALFLALLSEENRAVAIESPGYMGVIAACRIRDLPMVPVPVDRGGLHPGRLAHALKTGDIGGVYSVPTFQNPTGVTQQLRRRKRLLEILNRHNALLFEDDIYADLRFGGRVIPPIKSLQDAHRVIYASSFSKSLAPGLRIGFLVASGTLAQKLALLKETADISTGRLSQAIMAEFIRSGGYKRHLMRVRREYKRRRDAMISALTEYIPTGARFSRPKGGMHLWLMFDRPVNIDALEESALESGVHFATGALFFTDNRRASSLRLNFTANDEKRTAEGIKRLSKCIKKELEK